MQSMQAQSNPNLKEFMLIEFPAVVRNLDKALETLGGLQAISNAHFSSAPLELQFRPDNPCHSSLLAERRNQGVIFSGELYLVVRCRQRKSKAINKANKNGPSTSKKGAGEQSSMEMKCLGMVSTIYSFRNICDFQYLPLSNSSIENEQSVHVHQDLLPRLIPRDFPSSLTWFDEQQKQFQQFIGAIGNAEEAALTKEVESFLPPYQFSRYNNPSKFLLHDDVDRAVKRQTIGYAKSLRVERKALTITVNAGDPFPASPSDEALSDVDLRCKNVAHHRKLAELFAERPLWSRVAIVYRTHIQDAPLKVLLAKYAFYITSGPWGRLWCRFGYDPRLDPESRKFQSLMISFKRNQLIPERQRLRANTTAAGTMAAGQFCDYFYKPNVLPALRQMWYCLCDVQLPLAQKICTRQCLERLRECDSLQHGWLPPGRLKAIRRAIREDVAHTTKILGEGTTPQADEEEELVEYDDIVEPDEEEEDDDDDPFQEFGDEEEEEDEVFGMGELDAEDL